MVVVVVATAVESAEVLGLHHPSKKAASEERWLNNQLQPDTKPRTSFIDARPGGLQEPMPRDARNERKKERKKRE